MFLGTSLDLTGAAKMSAVLAREQQHQYALTNVIMFKLN